MYTIVVASTVGVPYTVVSNRGDVDQTVASTVNVGYFVAHTVNVYNTVAHNVNVYNTVAHNVNVYSTVAHTVNVYNTVAHTVNVYNTVAHTVNIYYSLMLTVLDLSSIFNKTLINLMSHEDMFRLITAAGIQQWLPELNIHPMVRELLIKVHEEMTLQSSGQDEFQQFRRK